MIDAQASAARCSHTLPGRAIVVGLAIKLLVFARRARARRACRRSSPSSTRWPAWPSPSALAYFVFRLHRAREAPPAVARPPQADPLLHLHRLRAGAPHRRVLRCCAASCCSSTSARTSCRAGCARSASRRGSSRRARRSRSSAPADATSRGILARRQANAAARVSRASRWRVVPVDRPCAAPRSGAAAPRGRRGVRLSTCRAVGARRCRRRRCRAGSAATGFSRRCSALLAPVARTVGVDGTDTHCSCARVAFPDAPRPGYAVVVDLLVTDAIRQQLRSETGVELKSVDGVARRDGRRREAARRAAPAATRAAATRPAAAGLLSSLTSFLDYRDWDTGRVRHADRDDAAEHRRASTIASRRRRAASARSFGQGLLLVLLVVVGGAVPRSSRSMALIAGLRARQVDHRIGARAVRRHRARAAGRLHAQDRGEGAGPARRAGAVVQLDDREHRGSAACRPRRRSGSRKSCASRTRSRCRCCRRARSSMPGLSVTALCVPGARGRRRLLRLPAARRPPASAC